MIFVMLGIPFISKSQDFIQEIINRTDTIEDLYKKTSSYLYLAEYFKQHQPDSAIGFANKALEIAVEAADSSQVCDAYKYLGISFAEKNNCLQAEGHFNSGLPYATNAKDSASLYADMGAVYTMCGDLKKAEYCYEIASGIYTRINDRNNLARLITNIGVMHARNANYYQASENYLEALAICEEMDDLESIAGIYQNMGEVMALQEQYDKAVGYYTSALTKFEELQRFTSMAGIYLNLGQVYIEQSQWDVAKHYLNKSYVLDTTYKLVHFESIALKLLGITYLRIDKLESAERLIVEALRMQKEFGFYTLVGETTSVLAEVYYEQGKIKEALKLLYTSEAHAQENSDDNLLARVLLLKSVIHAELKQFSLAYYALHLSSKIADSMFNIDKSKSIMNLELAYQTEKKEKQIDELKYNDSLRTEKLETRTFQVYLLIVSLVLALVILIFVFFYFRERQRIENQIRERRFLEGRFESEERAKDEIARELHDDIGGQLIGMILQLQSSPQNSELELSQLQNVYRDVRRLSHSLDEPLFVDVSLQEKIRNYLSELKESVSFETQFIDDLEQDWEQVEGKQELQRNIYRIVQELITNTIKYAKATTVDIQILNEANMVVLIYEDDGVGMPSEKLENNDSLHTIRKRVEMFGGDFEVNSSPGNGVFVKVTIPYKLEGK